MRAAWALCCSMQAELSGRPASEQSPLPLSPHSVCLLRNHVLDSSSMWQWKHTSSGDVTRFSTAITTPSSVRTAMAVDPSCRADAVQTGASQHWQQN